jgi:hypothetical protein
MEIDSPNAWSSKQGKIVALTYTANKEVQRLVWEEVAQSTETYLLGLTEKSLPEGLIPTDRTISAIGELDLYTIYTVKDAN